MILSEVHDFSFSSISLLGRQIFNDFKYGFKISLSAEDHLNQVSETMINTACHVLGTIPPKHRNHWFDEECEVALHANTRWITWEVYKLFSDERKRVYRLFICKRSDENGTTSQRHPKDIYLAISPGSAGWLGSDSTPRNISDRAMHCSSTGASKILFVIQHPSRRVYTLDHLKS